MAQDVALTPINFVTGTLGAGKSYYATRTAFRYLAAGKVVALNYDLIPYRGRHPKTGEYDPDHPLDGRPWWSTVYELSRRRQRVWDRLVEPDPLDRWLAYRDIVSRCYRYEDPEDLYDFRLPGDTEKEDRGLLVMDEGALRANSRMWSERKKENSARGRHALADLQFMLHIRKLGWTMLLLSQGFEMVDNQYRALGPVEIRLRNLNKMTIPVLNVPFSRKPRFIAIHYMRENDLIMRREYYGIDVTAGHYRSSAVFDPTADVQRGMRPMSELPRAHWLPHPDDELLPGDEGQHSAARARRRRAGGRPAGVANSRGEDAAVLVAPPETVMEHRT